MDEFVTLGLRQWYFFFLILDIWYSNALSLKKNAFIFWEIFNGYD